MPKPRVSAPQRNPPSAAPAQSTSSSMWRTAVTEMVKASAAVVAGAVVALTTPARDIVFEYFWAKPPKLEIVAPPGVVY